MRPNKVKVIGVKMAVNYVVGSPLNEDESGECDYDKSVMSIRDGMESQQERKTVLHETLHAVSDQMGLNLSEKQIVGLENGLFQVTVDNPRFWTFIRKG